MKTNFFIILLSLLVGGVFVSKATTLNGVSWTSNYEDVVTVTGWASVTTLTADVSCSGLIIDNGAILELNGHTLTINGNCSTTANSAIILSSSGSAVLIVTGNITTNSYNNNQINLGVNGTVKLVGNLQIGNDVIFQTGTLEMNGCGQTMDINSSFLVPNFIQSSTCGNTIVRTGGDFTISVTTYNQNCNAINIKPTTNFTVSNTINVNCNSTPTISLTPSSPSFETFSYIYGNGPSTLQSFSVNTVNLTNNLILSPPIGYEISTDNLFNNIFTHSIPLSIAPTNGIVSKEIFVRLAAGNIVNNYTGNITLESTGATTISIVVIGDVINNTTNNSCNPLCPDFPTSNGIDNTTLTYNLVNNGAGGATFDFSSKILGSDSKPLYHSSTAFGTNLLIGESRNPSSPLVLYNNDILFRGVNEVFHGLGYYGSSYGTPNPDKKRNFADTHIDGPVLFGFNGGALGVRQYENFKIGATDQSKIIEKVILQWTPNLVVIGQPTARVDLRVAGEIKCTELWVQPTTWYDHVFGEDYQLMGFDELRLFIETNKHLPDVPAESTVMENGLQIGDYNAILLKKVEEMTLYILELEKRVKILETQK